MEAWRTGDSIKIVAWKDPMVSGRGLKKWAAFYLGGTKPEAPLASPLYADLGGVGTAEVLLDDARRLCDKANEDGVQVELDVYDGMFHVWHFFAPFVPESKQAIEKLGEFARDKTRA